MMTSLVLAQTSASSDLLETARQSPFAPYIGGAVLLFVLFIILKAAAKMVMKMVGTAIIAGVSFFGWQWWQGTPQRPLADIRQEWFQVVKGADFSKQGLDALVKSSASLLNEAVNASRAKGQEASKDALTAMVKTLDEKIREASKQGFGDAKTQLAAQRDKLVQTLKEFSEQR